MNINLMKKKGTIKSNHWKGFRFLNLLLFFCTFLNDEAFQVLKRTNHSNNKNISNNFIMKKNYKFQVLQYLSLVLIWDIYGATH